jgi:hypothetical protein
VGAEAGSETAAASHRVTGWCILAQEELHLNPVFLVSQPWHCGSAFLRRQSSSFVCCGMFVQSFDELAVLLTYIVYPCTHATSTPGK